MVKRTNKALELVRLIGRKPDTYTFHEACAVVGMNAGYRYLIDTGVIVYSHKYVKYVHKPGPGAFKVRLGKIGREKLAAQGKGGSMAPV